MPSVAASAFAPLIETELAAYAGPESGRATIGGPDVILDPQAFSSCALVIHEMVTNSAKYAYYSPGMLNTQVVFDKLEDCVGSAVAGRVVRDDTLWHD